MVHVRACVYFKRMSDFGAVGVPVPVVSLLCPGGVPVSRTPFSTFILVSLRWPTRPNHWCARGAVPCWCGIGWWGGMVVG